MSALDYNKLFCIIAFKKIDHAFAFEIFFAFFFSFFVFPYFVGGKKYKKKY